MKALFDVPAPAKINLFLHVVGQRPDGYHLLQSVFVLIDWADTLHFERRPGGAISREDLSATLPDDDLCLRAARALQRAAGTPLGAHIRIDKQVPWGAGLGGGSSDAATTLLALNRLWNLHLPRQALMKIGLTLGADVPFFIGGHNAWVEGIGEQLTPIDLPRMEFALLKPAIAIPTAAIFDSPLLRRDSRKYTMAEFVADAQTKSLQSDAGSRRFEQFGKNDLQECAVAYSQEQTQQSGRGARQSCSANGELADALATMAEHFGNSRMSGSGSTVFSVLPEIDSTENLSATADTTRLKIFEHLLATVPKQWVGRLSHSLNEHPLSGWAQDQLSGQ